MINLKNRMQKISILLILTTGAVLATPPAPTLDVYNPDTGNLVPLEYSYTNQNGIHIYVVSPFAKSADSDLCNARPKICERPDGENEFWK